MSGGAVRAALAALLVLALGVSLIACGDSGDSAEASKETQITTATESLQVAIEAEDAKAFCDLLAPNDVEKLGEGRSDGAKRCLVVWGKGQNPLFGAADAELEIESVTYDGAYATAKLTNGGELGFAKEGGRWYVHLAPEGGEG